MPLSSRTRRRLLAGLFPALVVAAALPLLAPTCGNGQPGVKTFARSSLIIPMDVCYQYTTDQVKTSYTAASCPQANDPGDVIKAYGLVYQLVRNNIAVYWLINPSKAAATDIDLTLQYTNGPPVFRYNWSTANPGTPPTAGQKIDYRGGPFVVDGSDYAKASAILQQYQSTFGTVKVHVSNVAFQGYVAKTMAGGWSAGGTVPPKLALLDIGSSGAGSKNSEFVIQGYLQRAGLDTPGAGGCVTPVNSATGQVRPECGSATPTHGQIYDRLYMEDFQPDASGTLASTNLAKNGYQILWVPHWAAPSSCSDCPAGPSCSCQAKYSSAQISAALKTIGAFSASGGDVFAECAGLGSFEGVFSGTSSTTTFNATYNQGDPSTHFQTASPAGFWINASVASSFFWPGNYSSPFLQLGDYPFIPVSGAIQNYKAAAYKAETSRLVSSSADNTYDVFTLDPRSSAHGTIVYMGGHSYSGNDGNFEIAGTRLVLNTLFNLGAGCVPSGVACSTGLPGVCGQGVMTCDASGNQVCAQVNFPSKEVCDGLDNDCNGLVDDGLDTACYDGPPSSLDPTTHQPRGTCRSGVSQCQKRADGSYGMSACTGEVLPSPEICNGLDDDCNGLVDDAGTTANSLSQPCYTGPSDTIDPENGLPRGACKPGVQTCTAGAWGTCAGQVLPVAEICSNGIDDNCNGLVDEGCGCSAGTTQPCYTGATGTAGVGACKAGTQSCIAGTPNVWGPCVGEVVPVPPDCSSTADLNCNSIPDDQEPTCPRCPPAGDPSLVCLATGAVRVNTSPTNPLGSPAGVCKDGARTCDPATGVLGACTGTVLPSPEICDGKDNDCNGLVDDGATCDTGFACVNGACVPSTCGVEQGCPAGYDCKADASKGGALTCQLGLCGSATCAPGQACEYGTCVDPCASVTCGTGATCSGGACTGGGCYFAGCPSGQVCRGGTCTADPCAGLSCPAGTFCRAGDCVQACVFQTCPAGQSCGVDGFCAADPCAGKTCPTGQLCDAGACKADPCTGVGCGTGQTCEGGVCVDSPCNAIHCPAGVCSNGQCYPVPTLVATPPPATKASSSGCGCGSGDASPLAGLLLVLAVPLARRRRRPAGGGGPLALLLLLSAALFAVGCSSSKEKPFDASACAQTCGEQRCVDLKTDPTHCGACSSVCGAGQVCADPGVCGPSNVAPFVTGLSPAAAPKGGAATVPVALTGLRFDTGATVRTLSPFETRTYVPCSATVTDACVTVADSLHASVKLDLSTSPTTTLAIRVVNPDHVISNEVSFDVTMPTPIITSVTPPGAKLGAVTTILVAGSGFMPSSLCHMSGPGYADHALTTVQGATGLTCTLDPSLAPGTYDVWVVNDGTLASNHLTFTLSGVLPTITQVAPNAGEAGKVVSFTVAGTGFDSATSVYYSITGVTPDAQISGSQLQLLGPTQIFVPGFLLPTCSASGGCQDQVYVQNAAGASNKVTFYRGLPPPQVLSLNVTPQPLYQGDTAALSFGGSGIPSGTLVEVKPPVSTALTVTPSAVTSTSVTAAVPLTGLEAGVYTADLKFPSGAVSGSFQFRVFSNVAVLLSASPAGGKQGDTIPTLTLKGSNFKSGAHVQLLAGPAGSTTVMQDLAASYTPPDTLTATSLKVADPSGVSLATGVYSLVVVNPGAVASNGVSFSVNPGLPTLATIAPTTARQQDAAVPVTLTGTNFAAPDAAGNGGSIVHIASAALGITDYAIPASVTSVTISTKIVVQLDTRSAVPGTYDVTVVNPGPQTSNKLTGAFTVTP